MSKKGTLLFFAVVSIVVLFFYFRHLNFANTHRSIVMPMLESEADIPKSEDSKDKERQAKIEKALKDLKDKDFWVRNEALFALERLGVEEYTKDVSRLLKDGNYGVRRNAVWVLGKFGAKEYFKDIVSLLKDKDCFVQDEAERVLKEWGIDTGEIKKQKEKSKDTEKK